VLREARPPTATPTPNPSPAGCGLARFRQILKLTNPGEPGLVGVGEHTEYAAILLVFWTKPNALRPATALERSTPNRRAEPFPHAIPVELKEI
jgi:hypothetical protein